MTQLKRSMWLICGILAAAVGRPAMAGDMIAGAAGKTGAFTTKLKGMSVEGEREAIGKRMSVTGYAKHDLDTTMYDIYVPKDPGKDGKYGLMVMQNLHEFAKPPAAWEAVLEKYHLIWIAPEGVGDGSALLARVGYTLDAVYNAENTWRIDMNRVYNFNCSNDHPGAEVGLYYPEVFTASINCTLHTWFHSLPHPTLKGEKLDYKGMPKLDRATSTLAKTRTFVLIDRSEDKFTYSSNAVASQGYIKEGYQNTRILSVKTGISRNYPDMSPEWFDQSLAYIESIPAKTPAVELTGQAPEVVAVPATKPATPVAVVPQGKAAAAPATKPAATPIVVPVVSAADLAEEKAGKAVSLAKTYWAAGKNDIAKTKLEQVLKLYPKSNAAKDAKTLLDQINAQP